MAAARATWKGVLKISQVRIPIKVYPATESPEGLSFNQLHAACQSRIHQKKWCTTCDREVPGAEIVKGFEFAAGKYVLLQERDFDRVQVPSTHVIDLQAFADVREFDPLYVDRSYYLVPDAGAGMGYVLLTTALRGKVGLGKLALYGREYLVAVRVPGPVLLLHTLHHEGAVRSLDGVNELQQLPTVKAADVALARQVIAAFTGPLNLGTFTDDYQAGLRRVIDAKIAGQEIVTSPVTPAEPVVSLVEALRQSLEASRTRRSAKAATPKRKAAVA